jgi:hypothetical protein
MVEVPDVLRLWLRGHGYRRIAELVRADRKTLGRCYVKAAQGAGLERGGGEEALTDELLGAMAEQVQSGRPRYLRVDDGGQYTAAAEQIRWVAA